MSGDTTPTMPGLVHFLRPREGTAADAPADIFPLWHTFQPLPSGDALLREILREQQAMRAAVERIAQALERAPK